MTKATSKPGKRRPSGRSLTARPLKLWVDDSSAQEVRIEIIPLIDVIFCILTFFIIAAVGVSRQQAINLDLPNARTGVAQTRELLIVVVDDLGRVFVEDQLLTTDEELSERVEQLTAEQKHLNTSDLKGNHSQYDRRRSENLSRYPYTNSGFTGQRWDNRRGSRPDQRERLEYNPNMPDGTVVPRGSQAFYAAQRMNNTNAFSRDQPQHGGKPDFIMHKDGTYTPLPSMVPVPAGLELYEYKGGIPRYSRALLNHFRSRCIFCSSQTHNSRSNECPYSELNGSADGIPVNLTTGICSACGYAAHHESSCRVSKDFLRQRKNSTRVG